MSDAAKQQRKDLAAKKIFASSLKNLSTKLHLAADENAMLRDILANLSVVFEFEDLVQALYQDEFQKAYDVKFQADPRVHEYEEKAKEMCAEVTAIRSSLAEALTFSRLEAGKSSTKITTADGLRPTSDGLGVAPPNPRRHCLRGCGESVGATPLHAACAEEVTAKAATTNAFAATKKSAAISMVTTGRTNQATLMMSRTFSGLRAKR